MLAACALLATSCKEPAPVEPEKPSTGDTVTFPSKSDRSIRPGESTTISFSAAADWEASIPTSASQYFYIDDNGVKEYKVSGKSGSVAITISAHNVSGVYEEHSCELTLKMKDQSKVIALIKLIPDTRNIAVYPAVTDQHGMFVAVGSGEYEYSGNATTTLELQWPKGLSAFTLPVRIDADFEWSIVDGYPEWLELSATSSAEASTQLILRGNAQHYPLDDAEGKISFIDLKSGTPVADITVKIPGCKDIAIIDIDDSNIELNILGESRQNGSWFAEGSLFYLTGTPDSDVIAFQKTDSGYEWMQESWLIFTRGEADNPSKVVIDRPIRVKGRVNDGPAREAVLLALPGYLLKSIDPSTDILTASGSIKDEYAKYKFATVKQAGRDASQGWGVLAPVNSAYAMAVKGAGMYRTDASDPYYSALSTHFGTDEIYTLNYNNWYSYEEAEISASREIADVAYYRPDATSEDYDGNLAVTFTNNEKPDVFSIVISYFDEGYEEAVVLYDGEGQVLAVIICHMTETFWPEVKYDDIRFVAYDMVGEDGDPDGMILPQNVLLEEIKSGEVYEQYSQYDIPVWRLVYYASNSEKNAMIYVPPFPTGISDAVKIEPQPSWIKVEGALTESMKPYIHVTMSDKFPETGNVGKVVLTASGRPLFVLVCERAFMNK